MRVKIPSDMRYYLYPMGFIIYILSGFQEPREDISPA